MRKVWILVANSSQAKLYTAKDSHTLVELKTFTHAEGKMKPGELTSDHPGMTHDRFGFGCNTMDEKTSPKVKERIHFADELARALDKGFFAGEYERLYLIASASFLGFLRQAVHENVSKTIAAEVAKDLTQIRVDEIRDYLPHVL